MTQMTESKIVQGKKKKRAKIQKEEDEEQPQSIKRQSWPASETNIILIHSHMIHMFESKTVQKKKITKLQVNG